MPFVRYFGRFVNNIELFLESLQSKTGQSKLQLIVKKLYQFIKDDERFYLEIDKNHLMIRLGKRSPNDETSNLLAIYSTGRVGTHRSWITKRLTKKNLELKSIEHFTEEYIKKLNLLLKDKITESTAAMNSNNPDLPLLIWLDDNEEQFVSIISELANNIDSLYARNLQGQS